MTGLEPVKQGKKDIVLNKRCQAVKKIIQLTIIFHYITTVKKKQAVIFNCFFILKR